MILVLGEGGQLRKLPTAWASSFSLFTVTMAITFMGALPLMSILLPPPAFAQTEQTAPVAPTLSPPCATPDHRAFDFWTGTWDVTAAGKDAPSGINKITSAHGGCVIEEHYSTKGGYTGMSMSFYDAARKVWHQTWMGKDGGALFLEGGLDENGAMVLSNVNWPGYVKSAPINRVTWTPNKDGSVRQYWQVSQDGGKTWSDVFDGLYVKRAT
ncbi:hypothetical protein MNBD_ALPHA04-2194 [hydrothermal vent metagenome]|uniref:DUF1579 domain-containing protein n=1 Tax=hydrothermal vent metagenome TaxID=652676 RepID=A0A3B0S979_9ZZZZ